MCEATLTNKRFGTCSRMYRGNGKQMDSSKPASFSLRSTSTVTLNERFSTLLVDQLTQSRMRTIDPGLQQWGLCGPPQVVLLVRRERSSPLHLQRFRRRRISTRLGWRQGTRHRSNSRPHGFWSFMRKYRCRTSLTSPYRGGRNVHSRLSQRLPLRTRTIQKLTSGPTHLQKGGATASRRPRWRKDHVPTKKQLDAQLDEYMSMSKSRLDKQLDDYMSLSKRSLDIQLEEYMSMAEQMHWD